MSQLIEIKVPDIGDFDAIPVIELCVQVGDTVKLDDPIITLESDKATMDIPSSAAGVVKEIRAAIGDRVSQGAIVALIEAVSGSSTEATKPAAVAAAPATAAPAPAAAPSSAATPAKPAPAPVAAATPLAIGSKTHASPSVRLFARELGVDLSKVAATGPKGRIIKEDITAFVKGALQATPTTAAAGPSLGGGLDLLHWPKVDFA